jgi:hypothetical protein
MKPCYWNYHKNNIVTCVTGGRRYYATVVEWFHGYAHHSVLSRCMVTKSEWAGVGCPATVVESFHGYDHHSVLSRCMVTNSSKARFSIGPSLCYIKKATESRVSLSLRWSVFGVSQSLDSE